MIRLTFSVFITVIFAQLHGQTESTKTLYRADSGHVSFVSDAPLELISAESNSLKGFVNPEHGTFAFQLATQSLTGFNSRLQQEHFYENYIETEKYPSASFSGRIIEKVDFEIPGQHEIRAKGILEIHGQSKERIIKVNLNVDKDQFTAESSFMVNLDDHNITIPKLVYQKIAEEVTVNIHVTFKKQKGNLE